MSSHTVPMTITTVLKNSYQRVKDMRSTILVWLLSLISSRTKPNYSIRPSLHPSNTITGCNSRLSLSNNLSFNNTCISRPSSNNSNNSKWLRKGPYHLSVPSSTFNSLSLSYTPKSHATSPQHIIITISISLRSMPTKTLAVDGTTGTLIPSVKRAGKKSKMSVKSGTLGKKICSRGSLQIEAALQPQISHLLPL